MNVKVNTINKMEAVTRALVTSLKEKMCNRDYNNVEIVTLFRT